MNALGNAWDWLNHVLGYPLIALLTSLILGSSFLFSIVRKTASRGVTVSWDWLKERSQGRSKQTPAPRILQRLGVKIALDENISYYIAKMDPHSVGPDAINSLIHGPFCGECSYLLTESRTSGDFVLNARRAPTK